MRKLTAVLMFLLLTLCESAFALNDREYYDMKKDPFFRASDKRLTKLIDDMKNILPDKEYNDLRESHKAWIESGLDNTAKDLIANNNLAKVDAYVQATEGRIKYIERVRRQYTHEPENNSIAKTESDPQQEIKTQDSKSEPQQDTKLQAQEQRTNSDSKSDSESESEIKSQELTQETQPQKLTQSEAKELLERELKNRGLWQSNNIIIAGTDSESDSESDSAGGETLTLYDEANNKEENCWHFIHGEDFPDYISAINDYYVSMNDGAVYVLDTFDDVVRPIDEAEL